MENISTQGWDTVFALRLPEVNAQLARAVADTSARLPDVNWTSDDHSATLQASFGTWSISSKGHQHTGGTLVTMLFPVTTGTFTFMSNAQRLDGITLEASVQLTSIGDEQQHRLVVDPTQPITITAIDATPPPANGSIVRMAFGLALKDALTALKYAFATVNPSEQLKAAIPWLAPDAVEYCFMGGSSDADSYFGSLCMTDGYVAGNPLPPPSMSAGLIPASAAAALVISKRLFFRRLLLPGITKAFKMSSFDLADGDTKIVKRAGSSPIFFGTRPVDLSVLYSALSAAQPLALGVMLSELMAHGNLGISGTMQIFLEGVQITEQDGKIVFDSTLRCNIATASPLPEIPVATVRFTASSAFQPVMQPDGKVLFQRAGEPTHSTPDIEAPDWVKNSSIAVKFLLALVSTVVLVVTDGLALVLVAVVFVLLEVGIQFLPTLIQQQLQQGAGQGAPAGLEQLVTVAASPMSWTNKVFKPTTVALRGDLSFGGVFVV